MQANIVRRSGWRWCIRVVKSTVEEFSKIISALPRHLMSF